LIKKVLLGLALVSSLVHADFFVKGNTSVGVVLGSGSVSYGPRHTENYTIFGVNADYFVIDGLSVGLGYRGWFGGSPTKNQLTVPVTYYLPISEKFRPYAGVFVRETFVSGDYDNYESYGMRGGVTMTISRNSYIGVGVVQEYYSIDGNNDSSTTSPEFILAFSF